jgi:NAD-dependent deacetylase
LNPIRLKDFKNIVVLSGAGISAGSGLKTFRGPGGLWNEEEAIKLTSLESLINCPDRFWNFWGSFRSKMLEAQPNQAHIAMAEWEKQAGRDQKFTLITQNVDQLHQRAGSKNVVEVHGSNFRTRCSNESCSLPVYEEAETHEKAAPYCRLCSAVLRPDIVLFGEALPLEAMHRCTTALRDCEFFLAVGTSGTVYPASGFVEWAKYAGAQTVLVNLEEMQPKNRSFDKEYLGKAEEILPLLLR